MKVFFVLALVVYTCAAYELVGHRERRPFDDECLAFSHNCTACVYLDCTFYKFHEMWNKTFCHPGHKHPPMQDMIVKGYVNVKECKDLAAIEKAAQPLPGEDEKKSDFNVTGFVIGILVSTIMLLMVPCIWVLCKKRGSNQFSPSGGTSIPLGIMP